MRFIIYVLIFMSLWKPILQPWPLEFELFVACLHNALKTYNLVLPNLQASCFPHFIFVTVLLFLNDIVENGPESWPKIHKYTHTHLNFILLSTAKSHGNHRYFYYISIYICPFSSKDDSNVSTHWLKSFLQSFKRQIIRWLKRQLTSMLGSHYMYFSKSYSFSLG